jgi:hypothetical protein
MLRLDVLDRPYNGVRSEHYANSLDKCYDGVAIELLFRRLTDTNI